MLQYLLSLPSHIEVTVNEQHFYLVHGFPGNSIHEEVWSRPSLADMENPLSGTTLIVGHTPVVLLEAPDEDQQARYFSLLDTSGEIMRIFHSPQNWIDIDCGASYQVPGQALGCLCLDNMAEIYITRTNNHLLKAIVSIPTSEGITEHEVLLSRN